MSLISVISIVLLWVVALLLGFLLLGALRSIERLRWRMDQLEATMPSRVGRSGLRPGKKAPDFTLPSVSGAEKGTGPICAKHPEGRAGKLDLSPFPRVSLHDFAGRNVLVVFTQTGCGPCGQIIPELNRLEQDAVQVLVVNRGSVAETSVWAAKTGARFPVLAQDGLDLARRYEVFATPFAFLVNNQGVIASKGIVSNRRHIQFVLSTAHEAAEEPPVESESFAAAEKR